MWFLSGVFLGMFVIAIFAWRNYERGRKDGMLECQKLCEEKIQEKINVILELSKENSELKARIKELKLNRYQKERQS